MSKVSGLGYLGAKITDPESWHRFLSTVYGLERRGDSPEGVHQYRLDEQHHRIALYEGDSDNVAHVGWEVETREDLEMLAAHLSKNGIAVEPGEARLCEERAVMELIACTGPDGVSTEIFFGPKQDAVPFTPAHGMDGYNTGALGLGHIVLATDDPDETVKWYREMLGFSLSDYIFWDNIEATFLHCNPRHHTIAFFARPNPPKRLNHFMLQTQSIDDVGSTYYLCQDKGVPIARSLGRHTNDHMVSFYMNSPSGFEVEYGWGARVVDDSTWQVQFHTAASIWGHKSAAQ